MHLMLSVIFALITSFNTISARPVQTVQEKQSSFPLVRNYPSFTMPAYVFPSITFKYPVRPAFTPTPIRPTTIPSPAPTTRIQPTIFLRPTAVPSITLTSSPANTGDIIQNYIMSGINSYRKSLGLSEVKTDSYSCSFARTRAQEISTAFNHDGFTNRVNSRTLPYPSYSLITENIAMNPDYKNVVGAWINSAPHAENMRRDTPYVCVEKYGNYYAYEGWRP